MCPTRAPEPTPELVARINVEFDRDPRYGAADRVLSRLFTDRPRNTDHEEVLHKVVLLNGLYNTNVFAVSRMASHIVALRIDADLEAGAAGLVDRIARLTIGRQSRRHYSFATKYCSFHCPEDFPIYDTQVEKLLWCYRTRFGFAEFHREAMRDYIRYKSVLEAFRSHFGLQEFTFRQIDRFLWLTSKNCDP